MGSLVLGVEGVTLTNTATQDGGSEEGNYSRLSPLCLQSLPPNFLWCRHMLRYRGTEDKYVEGSAWLAVPDHLCLCALLARGDGGAPNSPGGAEKTKTRILQRFSSKGLQAGSDCYGGGQC